MRKVQSSQVPAGWEKGKINGPLFRDLVLLLLILVIALLVSTWIHTWRGHRHSDQRPSRLAVHFPSRGRVRWVGGRRWALSRHRQSSEKESFYFPFVFFLEKDFTLFLRVWFFHIGWARHPGPGPRSYTPGQLSIEFVNVGGWLTSGDLALDSCAQFLAFAEHRLIPSRARSVCHQLRGAGHHSVWAPACQDQVAGGHAGVGVVSLGGALSLLSHLWSLLSFRKFSGWVVY